GGGGVRLARFRDRNDAGRGLNARSSRSRSSPGARFGDDDAEEDDRHTGVAGPSQSLTDPEADDPGHYRLELEDHRGAGRLDESLAPELHRERERAAAHPGDHGGDEEAGGDVTEPTDRDQGNGKCREHDQPT